MLQNTQHSFRIQGFYRIHYLEFSAGYTKPSIPYKGWSVTFIDKGAAIAKLDGVPVVIESGHGFLLPPNTDNTLEICDTKAANLYTVVFELEDSSSHHLNSLEKITNKVLPMSGVIRGYLKVILKEAKFIYKNDLRIFDYPALIPNPDALFGSLQILSNYTELLLVELVRQYFENARTDYSELTRETLIMQNMGRNPFFDQMVRYLQENINKQITIEQISKDNFTNSAKVQKAFRECANEGVISFHQKMKIEKAKTLIRETSMNFTEISEMLGFSSVHYFSKKFKQLTKMSPSSYQHFVK